MDEKEYEAVIGLIKLNGTGGLRTDRNKKKKNRRQKRILECVFGLTSYPSAVTQQDLSILTKLPTRSVQIWFQNARHKTKSRQSELNDDNNEIPASVLLKILNMHKA